MTTFQDYLSQNTRRIFDKIDGEWVEVPFQMILDLCPDLDFETFQFVYRDPNALYVDLDDHFSVHHDDLIEQAAEAGEHFNQWLSNLKIVRLPSVEDLEKVIVGLDSMMKDLQVGSPRYPILKILQEFVVDIRDIKDCSNPHFHHRPEVPSPHWTLSKIVEIVGAIYRPKPKVETLTDRLLSGKPIPLRDRKLFEEELPKEYYNCYLEDIHDFLGLGITKTFFQIATELDRFREIFRKMIHKFYTYRKEIPVKVPELSNQLLPDQITGFQHEGQWLIITEANLYEKPHGFRPIEINQGVCWSPEQQQNLTEIWLKGQLLSNLEVALSACPFVSKDCYTDSCKVYSILHAYIQMFQTHL